MIKSPTSLTKTSSQVESRVGDLFDFKVVLVPSQVVKANPSDSQVYSSHIVPVGGRRLAAGAAGTGGTTATVLMTNLQ